MSEAEKLVQRLREGGCDPYCDQLEWDAADEIERLRAEVERLQAAVAAERERWQTLIYGPHEYNGDCPDSSDWRRRDPECPACAALADWLPNPAPSAG